MTTDEIAKLREWGARWLRSNYSRPGFYLPTEDAEDVLQDSLIELVRVDERKGVYNPEAFLAHVLDWRALNKMRAKGKRAQVEIPGGDTTDLSILSDNRGMTIEGAIFAADFDRAIRRLPDEARDAFILYELRGLTQFEAALLLGILPTTVVGRVEAAKAELRKELA